MLKIHIKDDILEVINSQCFSKGTSEDITDVLNENETVNEDEGENFTLNLSFASPSNQL